MASSAEDAIARVAAIFGTEVELTSRYQPINEDSDADVVDLLTRVCYFYPQYTLETAEQLTNDEVTALLVQAEKQKAIEYYNHALIAAAPHSKKGAMVNSLIKQYKSIAEVGRSHSEEDVATELANEYRKIATS